jgi:molecular chaperone GrpE (heat shock protein)
MSESAHPDDAPAPPVSDTAGRADHTPWSSTIYRLCEELIALRETNNRQHKLFEQSLTYTRDTLQSGFNTFVTDTQRAYQQLRQELHGEKRVSLALLQELLDIGLDLERIVGTCPRPDDAEGLTRWMESVAVQSRKVQTALQRHGVHPYDAVVGSAYQPALHERVGGRHVEGMEVNRVVEQCERGYASQQPEFVLRRPKVIVSE